MIQDTVEGLLRQRPRAHDGASHGWAHESDGGQYSFSAQRGVEHKPVGLSELRLFMACKR
ncbi:protein of unknown function (plasmid) [Cupriavidus taiwanensis]|uniref:Uncharacterized protein n=1 Tax=Cupriavidus taiwanensis TaxID=164546 RepID=A0A375ECR3_9BURK|nr:protein of unknown function [Cupriavidus taiwanensis]SOZ72413.1 protein of unknown function [Cupriavidus taiwanensis]SOZ74783.1 protein of unknown function [Cupriavidus taiwanensis]SPA03615.1 protein of unknown function [Cupriavidus taiwanensis]SPA11516.1 protein of unknown function [Cupriavidus taiwanensis]